MKQVRTRPAPLSAPSAGHGHLNDGSARVKPQSGLLSSLLIGTALSLATVGAHASGLDSGTTAVTSFEVWLYALGGVLAICYLLWVGFQCWSNKADWVHDFGGAIAKVAAVGAASALAPWAWSLFTS